MMLGIRSKGEIDKIFWKVDFPKTWQVEPLLRQPRLIGDLEQALFILGLTLRPRRWRVLRAKPRGYQIVAV